MRIPKTIAVAAVFVIPVVINTFSARPVLAGDSETGQQVSIADQVIPGSSLARPVDARLQLRQPSVRDMVSRWSSAYRPKLGRWHARLREAHNYTWMSAQVPAIYRRDPYWYPHEPEWPPLRDFNWSGQSELASILGSGLHGQRFYTVRVDQY